MIARPELSAAIDATMSAVPGVWRVDLDDDGTRIVILAVKAATASRFALNLSDRIRDVTPNTVDVTAQLEPIPTLADEADRVCSDFFYRTSVTVASVRRPIVDACRLCGGNGCRQCGQTGYTSRNPKEIR